ncbi:unnamed protein product [Brugia timori]|uniref:Uncharacterized protein n=1 Tax=Brugia timori TaxID=42155 RepID=A0A0R3R8K1_9BILA|nr:unnamed protein product [Brugia timori]
MVTDTFRRLTSISGPISNTWKYEQMKYSFWNYTEEQ